jgi:hypothetical protein
MSLRPFFLQADIRGETMAGFFGPLFQLGWDWRNYHSHLREVDVNYRYTEHQLPRVAGELTGDRMRLLVTRWMDHGALYWVDLPALRYWLQHEIVLHPDTITELRHFCRRLAPQMLTTPTVVTEEQYNGYQNTLAQRSDYNMNLSEIALAFAMGNHRRLGAASMLLMLSREEMTIIWNTVSPPFDTSVLYHAYPVRIGFFDSDDDE